MSAKQNIFGVTGGAVGMTALALDAYYAAPWAITLPCVGDPVLPARPAFVQPDAITAMFDEKLFAAKVQLMLAVIEKKAVMR